MSRETLHPSHIVFILCFYVQILGTWLQVSDPHDSSVYRDLQREVYDGHVLFWLKHTRGNLPLSASMFLLSSLPLWWASKMFPMRSISSCWWEQISCGKMNLPNICWDWSVTFNILSHLSLKLNMGRQPLGEMTLTLEQLFLEYWIHCSHYFEHPFISKETSSGAASFWGWPNRFPSPHPVNQAGPVWSKHEPHIPSPW